jgi:Na+-transporting NADH:ubiquinone oxidoreductase subunit NqrB
MGTPDVRSAPRLDPRLWQIASLTGLLIYGLTRLDFDVTPSRVALTIATALLVQWLATRWARLPKFDPKSALISALSLGLLLRSGEAWVAGLAAALAIGGKFLIRVRGKNVFNPTNFALIVTILLTRRAWVSPGQWGNLAFFAFLIACVGGLVVHRASRSDVTFAFLGGYAALLFGRMAWLGQKPAVPLHQMGNGAFLLFAFFMISDPRTTPDSRAGRIAFGALVALGAAFVTFHLYRPNGLLWSLAALSPVVPLIDRLLPGPRHAWPATVLAPENPSKEIRHETRSSLPGRVPVPRPAAERA